MIFPMVWLRHKLRCRLFFPAISSYCRWSSQYGPQHRVPQLHRRTQHSHAHRKQQQLQWDICLHASPEGGADAGQQTGCLMSAVSMCAHKPTSILKKPSSHHSARTSCAYILPVLTDMVYSHILFICLFFCLLNILRFMYFNVVITYL